MSEYSYTVQPPHGRGCGDERTEGDAYGCCGLSPFGMPIEYFVIDPVRPIPWQRGVKVLPRNRTEPDGVHDLVIFVGIDPKDGKSEGYPSAWSFVEECRHFGASRKLPKDLPFEKLTPLVSRMVFVHARAIPDFEYKLNREQRPIHGCKKFQDWADNREAWENDNVQAGFHLEWDIPLTTVGEQSPCTFALRDLAYVLHDEKMITPHTRYDLPELGEVAAFTIQMPSFAFSGHVPTLPKMGDDLKWISGAFLGLPLTHIETKGKDTMKPELKERIQKAGFEVAELEY
jgi:hypothetical protein